MTEQPFNPVTEQEYLGNRRPAKQTTGPVPHQNFLTDPAQMDTATFEFVALRELPLQHYAPSAHLLRGPFWSPGEDVELASLVRKCTNANKILAVAKSEAAKAEDALSLALGVENEAAEAVRLAELDLIDFIRKDTGL